MLCNRLCNRLSGSHKVGKIFLPMVVLIYLSAFTGCATGGFLPPIDTSQYPSGGVYTYQPLNPTTVWIRDPSNEEKAKGYMDADETSYEFNKALLRDLDTETVRIALNSFSGGASINAGIVGTSVKGQSYVLVVDYIKYITNSITIDTAYVPSGAKGEDKEKRFNEKIPMYTGIGLRVRAEFTALKSGLNISGLPALALAASSDGISGRMTVQTLGITGPEVTGLMPLISDISITSIQSAVQSVAAIKAKIYEESTTVAPKIIGFESPERDPALIRAIARYLYSSELWICPTVIKNPQDPTKEIVWIDWFTNAPEEEADGE